MKKLNYLFTISLLVVLFSCSDDLNEEIINEQTIEVTNNEFVFKSLIEINDPLLSNQLSKSENQIKKIISKEYNHLLDKYIPSKLFLDKENILVSKNPDNTKTYTFSIIIPSEKSNEKSKIDSYLTLSFDEEKNLSNTLQFGFEQIIYLDKIGDIITNDGPMQKYGYYSPKPSNKPSKAPKSVICNWASRTGNLGLVGGYCGYSIGIGGPAPISVLANIFPEWYAFRNGRWVELSEPRSIISLTIDYDSLYYTTSDGTIGGFSPYFYYVELSPFSQLHNEIINYYSQVYVSQLGYSIGNPYNLTYEEDHIHKQAFLDSFLNWTYRMQNQAPSNYNYLTSNPGIFYQIFNFFADYNLNNPVNEPLYLGQPWYVVQYTPNPDVKCINNGSDYLLTPAGLTLMQQLGANSINIDQFRNALPDCN